MAKNDFDHILTEEQLRQIPRYDPTLSPLAGHILSLFSVTKPRLMMRTIVRRTPMSPSTIRKCINHLIREGFMRRHGKGKGTWYTM